MAFSRRWQQLWFMYLFIFMGCNEIESIRLKNQLPLSPPSNWSKKNTSPHEALIRLRGGKIVKMFSAFFQSLVDPTFMMTHEFGNQGKRQTKETSEKNPFSTRSTTIRRSANIDELGKIGGNGGKSTVKAARNANDFESALASAGKKLVVVDFHATWCGPCKQVAPLYEEMSSKYKNVVFLKVDVDQNKEISSKYNVRSMPTFLFIKNSKVLTTTVGGDMGAVESNIKQFS